MSAPPPPPPPHGESPRTTAGGSGLPPGKYDIFIIPEHSAGAGFLYLPSLRPNINSFVAGFASALVLVVLGQSMAPAFQAWWANFQGMGNMGMMMLVIAVGLGAWSFGRTQQDGPGGPGQGPHTGHSRHGSGSGHSPPGAGFGGTPPDANGAPPPRSAPPPRPPPPQSESQSERPQSSWQRPPPPGGTTRPETPKGAWEKAREETRRKEDERKARDEERRRQEAAAEKLRELRETRERELRERLEREKAKQEREAKEKRDREHKEREDKDRKEREERERREKDLKDQQERDRRTKELRERLEREKAEKERERLRKEEEERLSRKGSTYAYSGVGERTNPWPTGKPPAAASSQPSPPSSAAKPAVPPATASSVPPSPKKPPAPTADSCLGTDEDAYSFRPYDKPKRHARKKSHDDASEASWAPSQSTARTTPPPSFRAPYSTKDPDKIVIRAVYGFLNQFAKTPSSQLVSAVGSVTDGLILRITTEGLFIDDDVRGVPQREWDVKAWTLKLAEVWCPSHAAALANSAANEPLKPSSANVNNASFLRKAAASWRTTGAGARGDPRPLTDETADAYLVDMLGTCKATCRLGRGDGTASESASDFGAPASTASRSSASSTTNKSASASQTGEWAAKGLHLLRVTVRDQEGKRYLFVLRQEEAWKVAIGLQRLRKGFQVRSLGIAGMSALETRTTLEVLGW